MSNIHRIIASLDLAQICWVVPNIHVTINFFSNNLGLTGFPKPEHVRAQDLNMTYYGEVVAGESLTSQTYNGSIFIELVQPISGQSMFRDYLERHPDGGVQHHAYRLPVEDFETVTNEFRKQDYRVVSEVEHPIARMAFFDTYKILGVVTEIMGITPDGWKAVEQMEKAGKKSNIA